MIGPLDIKAITPGRDDPAFHPGILHESHRKEVSTNNGLVDLDPFTSMT
jgi:hypothetical protein